MLTDIPYQRKVPKMPKCKPVKKGELLEYIKSEHYDVVKNDYGREKIIPSGKEWAEVKHGRWIKASTDGAVFCSECGTEWLSESAKYYKFCPICGARMEASDD